MKFVHAADIHLDSPMRGLAAYEGAPVDHIRGATRAAFAHLIELCLHEHVDFVLLAGDLYDGSWRDYGTGLFFARQMTRLREAAIPVFLVRGNHDAESYITRNLSLPDNVREFSTKEPLTETLARLGVAVHGQGYASKVVSDDLAARFPEALPDHFNIGLLHTCLDGREGHEPYAPTKVDTLRAKGYDYWALGHVHRREEVCRDPWIVFPGNLQGRQARECGAKGATLVSVEDRAVVAVDHHALDAVRWAVCQVDVSEMRGADDAVEAVRTALAAELEHAEGRPLAARVRLVGTSSAHATLRGDPERWKNEVRQAANDVGRGELWIERILFDTRSPIDLDAAAGRDDALGQLLRSMRELRADDGALARLAADLGDLPEKLRALRDDGGEGLRFDDADHLRAVLDDVEQLLVPRLLDAHEET